LSIKIVTDISSEQLRVIEKMKSLSEVKFAEVKDKTFQIIRVVELLCEVCQQSMRKKEKKIRNLHFASSVDLQSLVDRSKAHDRAEIDIDNLRIYFYDHDFPGDVHNGCIEKL